MIQIGNYFKAFATKTLVDVDVDKWASNQHEFNGSEHLRRMLGTPIGKAYLPSRIAYLDDEHDELPELFDTTLTWYDSRERHASRTEYRLLYLAEAEHVIYQARVGDTMFLAQQQDDVLLLLIAKKESTILRQLQWMFGAPTLSEGLVIDTELDAQPERDEIAGEEILALLDIEVELPDQDLELILKRFPFTKWPSTSEFAQFARSLTKFADPVADPDGTLMQWVTIEHRLFRTLERHKISESIGVGFIATGGEVDVDAFLKLSLSVHNRRKSRAGLSLEEHLAAVLDANEVQYVKKAKTEGRKEPDFLFPSKNAYDDSSFSPQFLTMLASKTTLKDRWRQVLNEADRIPNKHLLTLQPAISEHQTDEMKAENLRLVVPEELQTQGFSDSQADWLLGVGDFIGEVRLRATGARSS